MTKIRNWILLAVCSSAIAVNAAQPGSTDAATETAVNAAAKALSVAPKPAVVRGDEATAQVVVGGSKCTVHLRRDAKGPQGWLVTKLDCTTPK